jgi:hypothetical protein
MLPGHVIKLVNGYSKPVSLDMHWPTWTGSHTMDPSSCQTRHHLMGQIQWIWWTPLSVLSEGWYGPGIVMQHNHFCANLSLCHCYTSWWRRDNAAINDTIYWCHLGKPLHHQNTLSVTQVHGHLLISRDSCPKFLHLRTSVTLVLRGLPFLSGAW